jgi:hypothetical protein
MQRWSKAELYGRTGWGRLVGVSVGSRERGQQGVEDVVPEATSEPVVNQASGALRTQRITSALANMPITVIT